VSCSTLLEPALNTPTFFKSPFFFPHDNQWSSLLTHFGTPPKSRKTPAKSSVSPPIFRPGWALPWQLAPGVPHGENPARKPPHKIRSPAQGPYPSKNSDRVPLPLSQSAHPHFRKTGVSPITLKPSQERNQSKWRSLPVSALRPNSYATSPGESGKDFPRVSFPLRCPEEYPSPPFFPLNWKGRPFACFKASNSRSILSGKHLLFLFLSLPDSSSAYSSFNGFLLR